MIVIYLKSELNYGLGAINGEDASKAGGHGSQRARFPVSLCSIKLTRFPMSLRIGGQLARVAASLRTGLRSHASRSVKIKQLSARHLLQPLKPRHVASHEWQNAHVLNYTNVWDIKWQLFFQNAFVGCHYSSVPSLKMDMKNTTGCQVPFHDSMPSFMNFRWVLDLLEFRNKVSQRFAGNQRCPGVWNSFPFLACDLSMHPRTHFLFSTNLYALEHVHVVQIWIMNINALRT